MNSLELKKSLWENQETRPQYGDVLAVDALPGGLVPPHHNAFIINTDYQTGPGEHWISVYFPPRSRVVEFFDPMGFSVENYDPRLMTFLQRNKEYIMENSPRRCQSLNGGLCGQFCLYYLLRRIRGDSMKTILNGFDPKRFLMNDRVVKNVVTREFNV